MLPSVLPECPQFGDSMTHMIPPPNVLFCMTNTIPEIVKALAQNLPSDFSLYMISTERKSPSPTAAAGKLIFVFQNPVQLHHFSISTLGEINCSFFLVTTDFILTIFTACITIFYNLLLIGVCYSYWIKISHRPVRRTGSDSYLSLYSQNIAL